MIQFHCPKCWEALKAPADKAGARMKCPHCGEPVSVPKPSPVAASPFAEMQRVVPGKPPPLPEPSRPGPDAPPTRVWVVAVGGLLVVGPLLAAALLGRSDTPTREEPAPVPAKVVPPAPSEVVRKNKSEKKKETITKTVAPPARPTVAPPAKISEAPKQLRPPEKKAPSRVQTERSGNDKLVRPKTTSETAPQKPPLDNMPYFDIRFNEDHRFGICLLKNGRPVPQRSREVLVIASGRGGVRRSPNVVALTVRDDGPRLTFAGDGATNNTRILLDGKDLLFAMSVGVGRPGPEHDTYSSPLPYQEGSVLGWRSYRDFPRQNVRVIQDVSIRRGSQSGKLDTCFVQYTLQNRDTRAHNVGIRFMLDTFIGANDGVPFTIPGQSGLCTTWRLFNRAEDVPDFIQALERPNLRDPGTVAYLGLRFPAQEGLERPSSLRLCHWPGPDARWLVPPKSIREDSAVVIYWSAAPLAAGKERRVGFSYGLGAVAGNEGEGHLALSLGGTFVAGEDFHATAYISKPLPRETLTLQLPPGVQFADGERAEKSVPAEHSSSYAEISWRVRAAKEGVYSIKAKSNNGASQTQEARIAKRPFLP